MLSCYYLGIDGKTFGGSSFLIIVRMFIQTGIVLVLPSSEIILKNVIYESVERYNVRIKFTRNDRESKFHYLNHTYFVLNFLTVEIQFLFRLNLLSQSLR